jgi:hypothetical protein
LSPEVLRQGNAGEAEDDGVTHDADRSPRQIATSGPIKPTKLSVPEVMRPQRMRLVLLRGAKAGTAKSTAKAKNTSQATMSIA